MARLNEELEVAAATKAGGGDTPTPDAEEQAARILAEARESAEKIVMEAAETKEAAHREAAKTRADAQRAMEEAEANRDRVVVDAAPTRAPAPEPEPTPAADDDAATERVPPKVSESRYSKKSAKLPRIGEDAGSVLASMSNLRKRMTSDDDD